MEKRMLKETNLTINERQPVVIGTRFACAQDAFSRFRSVHLAKQWQLEPVKYQANNPAHT